MTVLNNKLVKLGKCVTCKKAMSIDDFTNVAMLRFYEPIKYMCASCIDGKTKKADTGLTASWVSPYVPTTTKADITNTTEAEKNFLKAVQDAMSDIIHCSICDRQSSDVRDFMVKETNNPGNNGMPQHTRKYYYCSYCVKEFKMGDS